METSSALKSFAVSAALFFSCDVAGSAVCCWGAVCCIGIERFSCPRLSEVKIVYLLLIENYIILISSNFNPNLNKILKAPLLCLYHYHCYISISITNIVTTTTITIVIPHHLHYYANRAATAKPYKKSIITTTPSSIPLSLLYH